MSYIGKLSWWCFSLLLVLGWQTSYATSEFPSPVKDILLEPLTDLTTDGPVKMSLTILPKDGFGDTLTFQIIGTQGLVPVGSDKRTILANKDGNFVTEFEILIPKNDSSQLTVLILAAPPWVKQVRWFVTTEDTVEYWKDHPRMYNGPFRSDPPTGRRGWIIPGEFPDLDSMYGIPPEMIHPKYREPDSTQTRIYEPFLPSKEGIDSALVVEQRRRMRVLEVTPLTGYGNQLIKIGDTIWIRKYGEKKFRVAEQITDLEAHAKAVGDSIDAIPPETMYDVLYFIKDTTQLTGLHSLVDNLLPTRREGVYRCRISKALIRIIEDRFRLGPTFPDVGPEIWRELFDSLPSTVPTDSASQGSLDTGNRGSILLYHEDFEAGWPTSWQRGDADQYNGFDYWGIPASNGVSPLSSDPSQISFALDSQLARHYHRDSTRLLLPIGVLAA